MYIRNYTENRIERETTKSYYTVPLSIALVGSCYGSYTAILWVTDTLITAPREHPYPHGDE